MSDDNVLFEIKQRYTIPYIIITKFWDILFFIVIMVILRDATGVIGCYNYSVYNNSSI